MKKHLLHGRGCSFVFQKELCGGMQRKKGCWLYSVSVTNHTTRAKNPIHFCRKMKGGIGFALSGPRRTGFRYRPKIVNRLSRSRTRSIVEV